ncbi:Glyceraldehyde 3-phosphate dehydrogenase, NAD binding domain [Alkalibacterium putridalgicola]|uniref:Glyceraldehyde 3-phosphate dehydrogenase, NAD binding domain n=1 Tax=Alkalibacterium putridalgicola TaxID=426703 RepID=A0A1H7VH92_9LACT|nr:hypothetical protein APU01nite_18620 [Alkalibacterium putridalgicola]SEM08593.1 Glyceraldehyde 3-phosphate dehydrogenase, NAD binding domain [Alkalibacterium putridalgicola]
MNATAENSQEHIKAGAKKVILTTPADKETKIIVLGVIEDVITQDDKLLSSGSCTSNDLAPVTKVLNDKLGIETVYMKAVKAYTPSQSLHDSPGSKDMRRGRVGAINAIPTSTGRPRRSGRSFLL